MKDVMVDAYGAKTALQNVAQVGVRDGRTLVVSVFDEAVTKDVERCIRGAGLGLNPISEGGGKLRVPIPKVSGSARDAMREVSMQFCAAPMRDD